MESFPKTLTNLIKFKIRKKIPKIPLFNKKNPQNCWKIKFVCHTEGFVDMLFTYWFYLGPLCLNVVVFINFIMILRLRIWINLINLGNKYQPWICVNQLMYVLIYLRKYIVVTIGLIKLEPHFILDMILELSIEVDLVPRLQLDWNWIWFLKL